MSAGFGCGGSGTRGREAQERGMDIAEIKGFDDPRLPDWLDIWQAAFPAEELVPFSRVLCELGRSGSPHHFVAGSIDDRVCAMAWYVDMAGGTDHGAIWLWYLAVHWEMRGRGYGAALLRDLVDRFRRRGTVRALVLEVEDPDALKGPRSDLAWRRIGFYQRLGCGLLTGVSYSIRAAAWSPRTRMCWMVLPFAPLVAEEAFELIRVSTEAEISRVGPLGLEFGEPSVPNQPTRP